MAAQVSLALLLPTESPSDDVLLPAVPRSTARPLCCQAWEVQGPLLHTRLVLPPLLCTGSFVKSHMVLLSKAQREETELHLGVSFAGSFHSDTTPDQACHGLTPLTPHLPPLLFDLESDPAENYDLLQSGAGPEVLQVLKEIKLQKVLFEQRMEFGESQIRKGRDPALQPCCVPNCTPKPSCCHCS